MDEKEYEEELQKLEHQKNILTEKYIKDNALASVGDEFEITYYEQKRKLIIKNIVPCNGFFKSCSKFEYVCETYYGSTYIGTTKTYDEFFTDKKSRNVKRTTKSKRKRFNDNIK